MRWARPHSTARSQGWCSPTSCWDGPPRLHKAQFTDFIAAVLPVALRPGFLENQFATDSELRRALGAVYRGLSKVQRAKRSLRSILVCAKHTQHQLSERAGRHVFLRR